MKLRLVEDLLLEKQWYKVFDKQDNSKYFYTYSKNKDDAINTVNNVINRKASTTQSYNRNLVDILRKTYSNNSLNTFDTVEVTSIPNTDFDRVLTTKDRQLRKKANELMLASFQKTFPNTKSIYVHHLDNTEFNNDINNVWIIGGDVSKNMKDVAHMFIHANPSTNSTNIPIYSYDSQTNQWKQIHTVILTLK